MSRQGHQGFGPEPLALCDRPLYSDPPNFGDSRRLKRIKQGVTVKTAESSGAA